MALGGELFLILVLTLLNGFFAAAEIGILSVRRTRLQELAERGRTAARTALALRDQPEQFLATVQVGITLVSATASALGGATLAVPLATWLQGLGLERGADGIALGLVVLFVSGLSIVLGELVPKSLALRTSETVSLWVARPLRALSTLARPLVWCLTSLSNLLLRPFHDQTSFTEARLSPEELHSMVEEASTTGSLSPAAGDIATRAIELGELPTTALLIPRRDVVCVSSSFGRDEVWGVIKNHPHERYPVVDHDLDSLEGYVTARDLIIQIVERREIDVRAALREIPMFPERMPASDILKRLQRAHSQIAAVVDEQGMVSGIVTIGDIAEQLLGEVLDEHELPTEDVRREASGSALVLADTSIQELNRALGLDLEISHEYATLSGLLMHVSTRIMRPGECIEVGAVQFEVVEATPRQVRLVRVRPASV